MPKVGRNELCHCGSGKKYKHCHWKADQDAQRSRLNMRRARNVLFARMADFAQRPRFEPDLQSAFHLFWDGRRDIKKDTLNRLEQIRFLEWYLIDYRSSHDRQRMIEMFRAQAAGYITPEERAYLGAWQSSQFSLFAVRDVLGDSAVRAHDLLRDASHDVHDESFANGMKPGELVLARLVTHADSKEFIQSVTPLGVEEKDPLIAFAQEKYKAYADAHFGATWNEFLRESSYLFNHYLLDTSGETSRLGGKVVTPTRAELQKTAATLSVAAPQT